MKNDWQRATAAMTEAADHLDAAYQCAADLPEHGTDWQIAEAIRNLRDVTRAVRGRCAIQESREIAATRMTRGIPTQG